MKKIFQLLNLFCAICAVGLFCVQAQATGRCYSKMNEVLGCFLKHDDGAYKYEFVEESDPKKVILLVKMSRSSSLMVLVKQFY